MTIIRDLSATTRAIAVPGRLYTTQLTVAGPDAGHLLITSNLGGFIVRDEHVLSVQQANIVARAEGAPQIVMVRA